MRYYETLLLPLVLLCTFNCTPSENSSNAIIVKDYINSSMIGEPILYCIEIQGGQSQICEYQISSKVNDSYYKGLCVVGASERFNSENIEKINFDVITQIDTSGIIHGVTLNRMGTDDYEEFLSTSESITLKGLSFSRQRLNALQGYSNVNCLYEMYTFDSMNIRGDTLIFNVISNKGETLAENNLETIKLKIPKYQARIIEDRGRIVHIQAETIMTQAGQLYHYTNLELDSTGRNQVIRCKKTYDFTPYYETLLSDYDFSGCFIKRQS